MAALNFPTGAQSGDTYLGYIFDGIKWDPIVIPINQLINGSYNAVLDNTGTFTAPTGVIEGNLSIGGSIIGDISLHPDGSGTVEVNGARITNVGAPLSGSDAVNKTYVDNSATGLTWKDAVNLLANSNVALTGTTGTLVIDEHSALTQSHGNGYRILLKNQSTSLQNGIYVYSDNGSNYTLTRSTDADVYTKLTGASVFILEGTTYGKSGWVQGNHYLSSFSGQQWVQFTGGGSYSDGDGLTLTGSTFSVNVEPDGGIEIAADNLQLKSSIAGAGLTFTSGVLDVIGTTDRIVVANDAIDISSSYTGQSSITTLGTVTTGTWSANTLIESVGGTNQTSYTKGDILYASANNTLSKLAAGNTGQSLQINSSGIPVWNNTVYTLPVSDTVTGTVAKLITEVNLLAGVYTTVSATIGCSNSTDTATLTIYDGDTLLATLLNTGTPTQQQTTGFTLANDSYISFYLTGVTSTTTALIYGIGIK
jgi:hypothetical protein